MFSRDTEKLSSTYSKRLTGVEREVFEQIPEVLNQGKAGLRKHPDRSTPPKLSNADRLLLLLMYYRECHTQFHRSRVCEIIKEIEGVLIKDTRFHLPGKKSLLKAENHFETVLIDVTESSVERPEKTEIELFGQEKAPYSKNTNYCE